MIHSIIEYDLLLYFFFLIWKQEKRKNRFIDIAIMKWKYLTIFSKAKDCLDWTIKVEFFVTDSEN